MMLATRGMRGLRGMGDYDYGRSLAENVMASCATGGCQYAVPPDIGCNPLGDINATSARDLMAYGYRCSYDYRTGESIWTLDPSATSVYSAAGEPVTAPPADYLIQYVGSQCPPSAPWNCRADVNLPQPGTCLPIPGFLHEQTGPQSCRYYRHTLAEFLNGCESTCAVPKPCDAAAAAALGFEIYGMDGNTPTGDGNCWYHRIGTPLPQWHEGPGELTAETIAAGTIDAGGPVPRAPSMLDTFGGAEGEEWISGIPNKYLIIGGGALMALMLLGGRR